MVGVADASHAEYGPGGTPIITLLECVIRGTEITVDLAEGSTLRAVHGAPSVVESATCNYGLTLGHEQVVNSGGMRAVGIDEHQEVRAVELADHPYFVATLYQPQLSSGPGNPHPVFAGLVQAAATPEQSRRG